MVDWLKVLNEICFEFEGSDNNGGLESKCIENIIKSSVILFGLGYEKKNLVGDFGLYKVKVRKEIFDFIEKMKSFSLN